MDTAVVLPYRPPIHSRLSEARQVRSPREVYSTTRDVPTAMSAQVVAASFPTLPRSVLSFGGRVRRGRRVSLLVMIPTPMATVLPRAAWSPSRQYGNAPHGVQMAGTPLGLPTHFAGTRRPGRTAWKILAECPDEDPFGISYLESRDPQVDRVWTLSPRSY